MANVNPVAFGTVVGLGAATIATLCKAAAVTATTTAVVGYSVLGLGCAAVGIASMTAWCDSSSTDVKSYFKNVASHSGIAIAGTVQFVAQTTIQSVVQCCAIRAGDRISARIFG